MKKCILVLAVILSGLSSLQAQELFVSTEPASNMARHSIGFRLTNEGMLNSNFKSRTIPEVMFGLNKNLMVHANAYVSDFYQKNPKLEGWGAYAKFRFLSIDSVQRHFRAAAFARYSHVNNPVMNNEINLEGDNSGLQGGLVFTQLLHKLALSGGLSYTRALDNGGGHKLLPSQADQAVGYTFSAGYLIYPKAYTDYSQPNVNLYLEFLGKSNPGQSRNLMEVAPAVQVILNSKFRIDLSQRVQLWGNMSRTGKNMYLLRMEYNLFNAF